MNETSVSEARSVTTLELAVSAIASGIPLTILLKHSPMFLTLREQRRELVRQAVPLYKEILSTVPYYANRPLDDPFWYAYVGSRVTEARRLVAHQNLTRSSTTSRTTPPSNG
jgi:hypothetical protein